MSTVSDLTKKSEDYRQASAEMEKMAESLPEVIADLQ